MSRVFALALAVSNSTPGRLDLYNTLCARGDGNWCFVACLIDLNLLMVDVSICLNEHHLLEKSEAFAKLSQHI